MSSRSYNPSSLALARKCEICYKLRYIDMVPEVGPRSADLEFGQAMHLALQTMVSGEEGYAADFELYWNLQKGCEFGRFSWEQLRDQGLRLLDRFERLYLKRFKLSFQEQKMEGELNGIRVHGTPDFIGDFDGIPSIVDFKTSGQNYHKEAATASEQMIFYAWLAKTTLGYDAKQVVYMPLIKREDPSIQKPVIAVVTPDSMLKCVENYYQQCLHLENRKYYVMNYSHAIQGDRKNPCFEYWFGKP